jgi:AcrR family transcriptional regulator
VSVAAQDDPSDGQPRRRRLEPDERRQQILACAVRLFGERPYDVVSTTDIARDAGVARGLINHYFGTKKDLYLEVVRVMVTIPDVALRHLPDGDLRTRVDASVTWFLDVVSKHAKPWLAAIGATTGPSDPDVARILTEADEDTADRILAALGVAKPGDTATPEELRAMARVYVGFARIAAVEWLVRGSLSRGQVHVLLTSTLVTLVEQTSPVVMHHGQVDPS